MDLTMKFSSAQHNTALLGDNSSPNRLSITGLEQPAPFHYEYYDVEATELRDVSVRTIDSRAVSPPPYTQRPLFTSRVSGDDPIAWLSSNLAAVSSDYPHKWIVVADNRIVASADDPEEALSQARQLGIKAPFLTRVPENPVTWRMAFAG